MDLEIGKLTPPRPFLESRRCFIEPYASLSYAFITTKAAFPKWRGLLYLAASSDIVPPKSERIFVGLDSLS